MEAVVEHAGDLDEQHQSFVEAGKTLREAVGLPRFTGPQFEDFAKSSFRPGAVTTLSAVVGAVAIGYCALQLPLVKKVSEVVSKEIRAIANQTRRTAERLRSTVI
jgi:hypothetical protein